MPGAALSLGARMLCAHGGSAQPTGLAGRVLVGSQPVLVAGIPLFVAGCANPPPPAGVGPCVLAQFLVAATRVRAQGQPVLIDGQPSLCTPTGSPLILLSPGQLRVRAV